MILFPLLILTILLTVKRADAATVVDYPVTVFSGAVGGTSSSTTFDSDLRKVYATATYVGGYSIQIPASDVSGYMIVAGYYPITSNASGSGWFVPSSYQVLTPFYQITTGFAPYAYTDSVTGQPFTGIVYIPAHSQTIRLTVYGHRDSTRNGAGRSSNAIMYFVPDNEATGDVVSGLQDINQSIQNIYNEIQSSPEDDQYADELLEQLQGIMDSIDELTQQIEENTNRPPPESLVPSMPPVLVTPPDAPSQDGRTAISDILATSIITNILIMVFSLAFLRYVLFGKSK